MSENRSVPASLMLLRLLALLAVLLVWPENRVWAFAAVPPSASGQTVRAIPSAAWEISPLGLEPASGCCVAAEEAVAEGTSVYRVFGENNNPLGQSWTRVDPSTVANYRDAAGLPDVNTGRFVIEGTITDTTGELR